MPQKIELKTGFGYIKDAQGRIIMKFELPQGEHLFPDDVKVVEVESLEELNLIEVYQEPEPLHPLAKEYAAATTLEEKIDIIARVLRLK